MTDGGGSADAVPTRRPATAPPPVRIGVGAVPGEQCCPGLKQILHPTMVHPGGQGEATRDQHGGQEATRGSARRAGSEANRISKLPAMSDTGPVAPLSLKTQVVRFVVTGGLSAVVDFGLYVLLLRLGLRDAVILGIPGSTSQRPSASSPAPRPPT